MVIEASLPVILRDRSVSITNNMLSRMSVRQLVSGVGRSILEWLRGGAFAANYVKNSLIPGSDQLRAKAPGKPRITFR